MIDRIVAMADGPWEEEVATVPSCTMSPKPGKIKSEGSRPAEADDGPSKRLLRGGHHQRESDRLSELHHAQAATIGGLSPASLKLLELWSWSGLPTRFVQALAEANVSRGLLITAIGTLGGGLCKRKDGPNCIGSKQESGAKRKNVLLGLGSLVFSLTS